jgi:hypothetical protein
VRCVMVTLDSKALKFATRIIRFIQSEPQNIRCKLCRKVKM